MIVVVHMDCQSVSLDMEWAEQLIVEIHMSSKVGGNEQCETDKQEKRKDGTPKRLALTTTMPSDILTINQMGQWISRLRIQVLVRLRMQYERCFHAAHDEKEFDDVSER